MVDVTRNLRFAFLGDSQKLEDASRRAAGALDTLGDKAERIGAKMESVGRNMTTKVTLPIVAAFGGALKAAEEQAKVEAQLDAALKSTGAQAGVTAESAKAYAASLQQITTFGDEAIIGGQNLLLTFTNIKNEVGEGNDVFDQATGLMLDMSTAMGTDLKSSAIQMGKALNDPVAGISALTRVGVQFTDQQKEQIKTLVESGDTMGAQKVILAELETQFGGSAEAMAATAGGKMKQAMNALGDAGEQIGTILAPVLTKLADMVRKLAGWFQNLSPGAKQMIVTIAGVAAAIGPLLLVGGKLVSSFSTISKGFQALSAVMSANPWVVLIAATVALVTLIVANWDKIKAFLIEAWDKIKAAATAVWEWIRDRFQAVVDFLYGLFLNWTLPGLIIQHWDKIKAAATAVKDWIQEKFQAVVDWFKEMPTKISKAVVGLWDGIKESFRAVINWVIDKWNAFEIRLGGQRVNLPFGLDFDIPEIVIKTPNIPRLHTGGVFRAPTPGGEGLAVLRDRERVIPAGVSGGESETLIIQIGGDELGRWVVTREELSGIRQVFRVA